MFTEVFPSRFFTMIVARPPLLVLTFNVCTLSGFRLLETFNSVLVTAGLKIVFGAAGSLALPSFVTVNDPLPTDESALTQTASIIVMAIKWTHLTLLRTWNDRNKRFCLIHLKRFRVNGERPNLTSSKVKYLGNIYVCKWFVKKVYPATQSAVNLSPVKRLDEIIVRHRGDFTFIFISLSYLLLGHVSRRLLIN